MSSNEEAAAATNVQADSQSNPPKEHDLKSYFGAEISSPPREAENAPSKSMNPQVYLLQAQAKFIRDQKMYIHENNLGQLTLAQEDFINSLEVVVDLLGGFDER